jgi:UDP-N-acetylmuramate dehydrogenase
MASAGSVFRNPPAGPSAGELIDGAGLKGRRVGGAVVSDRHANFIVNDRRGTAADVRRLAEAVADEVDRATGVRLQPEVEFVGDWRDWPWPSEASELNDRAAAPERPA